VNPFRAALEGLANAIHGIGARRTAKVHRTFGSGSPLEARRQLAALRNPATLARPALTVRGEGVRRLRRLTPAAYTPGYRSHGPLFVLFVQDFRLKGLICFNLQAIVPQRFFVEKFLSETSDFMFQRFLRSKLKHGV
jgi:hypothetical protein